MPLYYFGSALGGLRARIARHLRQGKETPLARRLSQRGSPLDPGLAVVGWAELGMRLGQQGCRHRRSVTARAWIWFVGLPVLSHLVRVNSSKQVSELLLGMDPAPHRLRLGEKLSD